MPRITDAQYEAIDLDRVNRFYGEGACAKRSGVPLMNHIREGLRILHCIDAPLYARRAFILHPMYQTDEALTENMMELTGLPPGVIIAILEYRQYANRSLPDIVYRWTDDTCTLRRQIELPPMISVRQMLIADKVQNRKDFDLHRTKIFPEPNHPRAKVLDYYFWAWFVTLDISLQDYVFYCRAIDKQEPLYG